MSELVEKLTRFNPNYRFSAADCLKDPIFNEIRLEQAKASKLIECSVDDKNVGNTVKECLDIIEKIVEQYEGKQMV